MTANLLGSNSSSRRRNSAAAAATCTLNDVTTSLKQKRYPKGIS
jgi:hypothetical protein